MDNTYDPSGMTDGVLAPAGVVIRAIGPKTVTTQTRSDGYYTLSFTNTPVGTYDVCITPPSGYTANPPSGCENVVIRLSARNDTTLDFFLWWWARIPRDYLFRFTTYGVSRKAHQLVVIRQRHRFNNKNSRKKKLKNKVAKRWGDNPPFFVMPATTKRTTSVLFRF